MNLSQIKAAVQPGDVFDVTNHYITREDHPCYGTRRGTVFSVTGSSFWFVVEGPNGGESRVEWPKAAQVSGDADVIELRGGGVAQGPQDPFLTLTRVRPEPAPAPADTPERLLADFDAWREERADLSANDGPGTDPDDWAASDDTGCDLAQRFADLVRAQLAAEDEQPDAVEVPADVLDEPDLTPVTVCATCEDYVDDPRLRETAEGDEDEYGAGWVHVFTGSSYCPGQEDDDTGDYAEPRHTTMGDAFPDGLPA